MGSVNVSQAAGGRGVSATISWGTGPEVTVKITGNAGYGAQAQWRIRGKNPDTTVYINTTDAQEKTFDAEDGKTYAFQAVWGNTSDGDFFTVSFDSGGGDSGGDSGGSYTLSINKGEGTSLKVERTWNESTGQMYEGEIYSGTSLTYGDVYDITFGALTGYKDAKVTLANFDIATTKTNDDGTTTYHGTMTSAGNIVVTSSATLKSYKLTLSAGTGSSITVKRTESRNKSATLNTALSNDATIWHHDVLQITFKASTGYKIATQTVNGSSFTSGSSHTVAKAVSVASTASVKSYTLTLNADTGSTITVNRTSSPLKKATTGNLSNGATIYYNDVLKISFSSSAEYKIQSQLVNQSAFTSGNTHTVNSNVEVVTITGLYGLVHIHDGTSFGNYLIYIYDGSAWVQYLPYVYDGTNWVICS